MHKTESRRPTNRLNNTINEGLEPEITVAPANNGTVTFRLVITTQIHENYGAHCWDGTGECPQYWKAKGGEEYHRNLGTANEVIEMGQKGIHRVLADMRTKVETLDDYWHEYVIDWSLVPSNEETYGEQEAREMLEWGWISPEQAKHYGPKHV